MFYLGKRSLGRLSEGKMPLQRVVARAIQITEQDFTVLEVFREAERQLSLWQRKASKLNGIEKGVVKNGILGTGIGKHQLREAVDLGAYLNRQIRWDWPLYYPIADSMRQASIELEIPIVWGGVWDTRLDLLSKDLEQEMSNYAIRRYKLGKKPFHDGPHFQLA